MEDTIVAISTALGVGAISIIRLSGPEAISIVRKVFSGKNFEKSLTHTIKYGYIKENGKIIDEVLVSVMKSPKTFTAEDVVEINCHGGVAATNKILELVLVNGARLAEPGEFTKRAFLNGRIDLVEAESVMDLINAKTDKARNLAINGVSGNASKLIRELREKISKILTNIEVNIDYPEYEDILVVTNKMINDNIIEIKAILNKILSDAQNGKIIRDGLRVLILGRPNVGKSSILNKLLDEEKAIVTEIEGTTRDIVEGRVNLDGIILNIIDTAGVRKTDNIVESIGVNKALKLIDEVDLIILVLNNGEKLIEQDFELLKITENKKRIIFINKSDLNGKLEKNNIPNSDIVEGDAINESGLYNLKKKIKEMFNINDIEGEDLTYLSNSRQIAILKEAMKIVSEIEIGVFNNTPIDLLEVDIKKIWELLGDIIGENYEEELMDKLFSQFCLGK